MRSKIGSYLIWIVAASGFAIPSLAIREQAASREPRPAPPTVELEEGYEWLWDAASLRGWEGNPDWFRIEESSIVAGSLAKDIPHNEFLSTAKSYGDFELKLHVRLKGAGDNAGVQFRTARIPNSTEVSGYQCDVGTAWGRPVWGGLYDESRRNKMLAEGDPKRVAAALKPGDWNELMVRASGEHIQIWLNGTLTVEYTEMDPQIARQGIIALQIHSGPPTEAWYANMRIREIKPAR